MAQEELSPEELSALLGSYMPEIQGYRVLRRVGKGGMSYVYLGVQVSLDRQVAIKVMSPSALADEKSKQRFEQEARTIAKLEHPSIVSIHEVGRTPQGLMYYVMPYLAKGHLGQRDFTHEESRAVDVLRSLLSALEYAHTRGIVHRDVKAENVLFDNADRPLLTDFGIALTRRDSTRITTAGLAIGSGGYMAPEQARGEPVDGRADLYSVGVLTYELLCGELPYQSPDPLGLALMHAQDPTPQLPASRSHWQPFIDRAMAKSPTNRFRNAQQMLTTLDQIASGRKITQVAMPSVPSGSRPAVVPTSPVAARPITPQLLTLILASGVLLTALAVMWMRFSTPSAPKNQEFFTPVTETPAAAPMAVPVSPAIPAATSEPDTQTTQAAPTPIDTDLSPAHEPAQETVPAPVPPPALVEPAATTLPWAQVAANISVARLDYNPTVIGARQLATARLQLDQKRLLAPPGDNVLDSLTAAHRLSADPQALAKLDVEAIAAIAKALNDNLKSGRDDALRSTLQRAEQFARDSGQANSKAWKAIRAGLIPPLVARLDSATQRHDGPAIDKTKALVQALAIDPALLEPAWSRAVLPVVAPVAVVRGPGLAMVSLRPGVAVMRNEVTRAEYAQFANSTQRPVTRCRNRLAAINFKRRTWTDPGFTQTDSHPVVCISQDDAVAYAQWLSQKTGATYRLPSLADWQTVAGYRGNTDPCLDGRIDCGQTGTVPASQGPASPLGLNGAHGNVREWLDDCAGGCNRRLVAGLGWRDTAARSEAIRSSPFDARVGFDDVGFRLVRVDGGKP